MKKGNKYGVHRVIEPAMSLPQPATKIDNTMEIYDNELLIDVDTLNNGNVYNFCNNFYE